jgi:membrane-associated protease RseP (regulator of RpoE activity)
LGAFRIDWELGTMNKTIGILLVVCLTGCATVPRYTPVIDMRGVDPARYEADLTECEQYALQVSPVRSAVAGAAAVSVFGALLGAATGDRELMRYGARNGAVQGAAAGAAAGLAEQHTILQNCLTGRGYLVLGAGIATSPRVASAVVPAESYSAMPPNPPPIVRTSASVVPAETYPAPMPPSPPPIVRTTNSAHPTVLLMQQIHGSSIRCLALGVDMTRLTPSSVGIEGVTGVMIASVFPGSAAAEAGIRPGDIVVRMDEAAIDDPDDIQTAASRVPSGTAIQVKLSRQARPVWVSVRI